MTARFTSGALIDPLTEGKSAEVAQTIERLVRAIDADEDRIEDGLRWVKDKVFDIERALTAGSDINSLGVFQRIPVEVDQAIALRAAHRDLLASLVGVDRAIALDQARREATS